MMRIIGILFLFTTLSAHADPVLGKEQVVLQTEFGPIVLALYSKTAPETVKQFLKLVRLGVYDTTHFFRVHPGFVAQVSEETQRERPLDETQRAALKNIRGEFSGLRHEFGVLSMARWDNDPNSARMSFSILLGEAPHLDGKYTIFGQVTQGYEVLRDLQAVPREGTAPTTRLTISKMSVADNEAELAALLQAAESTPKREVASVRPMTRQALIGGLLLIAFVSAVVALLGRRIPERAVFALHLSNLLIAVFALVVALGPLTANSPWLGAALVLGLLTSFRLLGRFETL